MTQHKNLEQTYDSFPIYMYFKCGLFVEIYFRFDIFCAALWRTRNILIRGQGFFDNLSRGYYGHNKYAFRFSLHSLGRKEYLLKIGPTLNAWFETIWHFNHFDRCILHHSYRIFSSYRHTLSVFSQLSWRRKGYLRLLLPLPFHSHMG